MSVGKIIVWVILGLILSLVLALRWWYDPIGESAYIEQTKMLPEYAPGLDAGYVLLPAGDWRFNARVAGLNNDGSGVILLHGFPETSIMYTDLIDDLAAVGHRVVAFNQRGYSPQARPQGAANYNIGALAGDVIAVADALDMDTFHLVGHDWGSAVGWATSGQHPQRVRSWSALSVPHLDAFLDAALNSEDQREKSAYFMLFRTPVLGEMVLKAALQDPQQSGQNFYTPDFSDEILQHYADVFGDVDTLSAALNWYRSDGLSGSGGALGRISTPTLMIWGEQDIAIGRQGVDATEAYMDGPYKRVDLQAGHWLIQEKPMAVRREIIQFIAEHDDTLSKSN